ncbi:MAG: hypothetical protein KGI71_05515 [Patescibacteria group bacterium]|nr:hypothetical protein [Patescibacteria group bacterium]
MLQSDYVAFKADANANFAALVAAHDWPGLANAYNALSSPAVMVWRPSVPVSELASAIDWTADANGFQALTVSKQNTYFALTQGGTVDATQVNIRNGFGAIFPAAIATALAAVAQVQATRFQALFTTNGVTTYFGASLSPTDVQQAMA